MRLIELIRRPPSWLRIAFAGLALAFLFSSIAQVAHQHEAIAGSAATHVACGYCLTFDGLTDDSVRRSALLGTQPTDEYAAVPAPALRCFASPCAAQPRAPPVS
jgi:hypothetical protein